MFTVGMILRCATSLRPQSSSMVQLPSPYLMPQPSLGKANQIIKEHYKMQATVESDLGSQQLSDPKHLTTGRNTFYINTHVVPTDPQTGYSTLLRTEKLTPMDPLYDSIKEKDKCVLVGSNGDKVVAQTNRPSSVPPLELDLQTTCSSNNPGRQVSTRSCVVESFSSEIVVQVDDSETGYEVLKPDKPIPDPPPGAGSVPAYDIINLKLNSSYNSLKLQNVSHTSTSSIQTLSPSHNTACSYSGLGSQHHD